MNKLSYSGLLFFFLFSAGSPLFSQEYISGRHVAGVCYAGTRVNRIYIPPPKGFMDKARSKGAGNISVTYTGFTTEARNAFEYSMNIIESILPAGTNIHINASWTKISSSGVLGNSSITGFAAGWGIDALEPYAYYPVSVAEKIAGRSLNEDWEADIELVFNSNANWYMGTDGNTPVTKYDLVTVVIHEIIHGLGFFDSMNAEDSEGSYGIGPFPLIYDKYVSNLSGSKLTDTTIFFQNSWLLYDAITGGQLYFDGPLTKRYLSGGWARLYAPSTFDPGSSVSHLDELRTSSVDALMTPFIDFGEAIHDPGMLTKSILGDLGWINTKVIHQEPKDTETPVSTITINAEIASDTAYNRDDVRLYYSFNDFADQDFIVMSPEGNSDRYTGILNVTSYNTKLDYYFSVNDYFARVYKSPSRADKRPYSVFIGTDTVKPVILHDAPEYFFEKIDTIHLKAVITDNLGVDTAYVEYRINAGQSRYIGMNQGNPDEYKASLALRHENLKGDDVLEYRIVVIDKASGANMRVSPSSGFNPVRIEALMPAVRNYSTDFSDADEEFFNSGFTISTPAGFSNSGLHSEHPYKSPDEDYKTLEFSSVLRRPVIFDQSGMVITFKELVLVEPGAEGSVFGFSDFFDYVILEASGDFGKTWFSLADGYDSRYMPSWETAYNSKIEGQNSTFQGDESKMIVHAFYPRIQDKISSGDSLLIRFRLFSDPYANGWGWALDDLRINPLVDYVNEVSSTRLKVYPNPGDGHLKMAFSEDQSTGSVRVRVYNFTGYCVYDKVLPGKELAELDISEFPAGLYFIVVSYDGRNHSLKYNLVK